MIFGKLALCQRGTDEVKTGAKSASAFRRRGDLRRGRHCTPHFARNSDL
jgi:hypothetical protein